MDYLREEGEVAQDDQPELVAEEVGQGEVEEKTQVELDVEGSQFLPQQLGVLYVGDVVRPPHQEQHLHIEDNEQHDVGQCRQDEEEISALS